MIPFIWNLMTDKIKGEIEETNNWSYYKKNQGNDKPQIQACGYFWGGSETRSGLRK